MIGPGCRIHGPACGMPWGFDEAHTDQPGQPYTLDQLAERGAPPQYFAYPDYAAYVAGFALWRALRRDNRPTPEEALAATAVKFAAYPPMRAYIEEHPDSWPEITAAVNDITSKET